MVVVEEPVGVSCYSEVWSRFVARSEIKTYKTKHPHTNEDNYFKESLQLGYGVELWLFEFLRHKMPVDV